MPLESVLFQSSVLATPPVGTKVAADHLASGEDVQYLKAVDGRPNSELVIPGDSTYGWWQNLKALNDQPIASGSGVMTPGTVRVAIASNNDPVPVTGAFYPATQPVSGTVAISGSVAVTGAFYQVTQPVSIAVPVVLGSAPATVIGTVRVLDSAGGTTIPVSLAAETTKVIGTVNLAAAQSVGISGSVALAAAQVAIPLWGHAAIGAAAPTGATAEGLRAASTLPAGVADGLLVNAMADLKGRLVNVPLAPRELVADNAITLTTTAETTLLNQTAAEYHDLTTVVASNTSATATRVDFRDTTGGTVRFSLNVPAGATVGFNLPTPRPQGAPNTNWTAQLSVAVTDVRVYAQCVRNK